MSAIPRPHRQAQPGEIVNFYAGGDPTELPVPALVQQVHPGGSCMVTYAKAGHPGTQTAYGVKHIHDAYWDSVPVTTKQATGCFDFHPVYKGMFDRYLNAIAGNEARRKQLEEDRAAGMNDDEYNALTALERHGDNIAAISEETGITRERLKKLAKFNEALKAVKQQKWEEKNGVATPDLEPAKAAE
jgi:hypothetical protein